MAARHTTIALGMVPSDDPARPRSAPAGGWLRRPRGRRWTPATALLTAVALAGLVGATATAAAPPSPPRLTPLFTVPDGDYAIVDGDVLLAVGGSFTSGDGRMTAYRLADGGVHWDVGPIAGPPALAGDGVVLVTGQPEENGEATLRTTAYETDTGRERWSRQGYPGTSQDGLVILESVPHPSGGPVPPQPTELTAVELTTGAEVWSSPPVNGWAAGTGRVVTWGSDGLLASYDLRTGEQLATRTVAAPAGAPPPEHYLTVAGRAAVAYVAGRLPAAYDVDTLDRLWAGRLPDSAYPLQRCGRLLCVYGSARLSALDPATGRAAWTVQRPDGEPDITDLGRLFPSATGQLLVDDRLVDAATGERLLDLTGWEPPVGLLRVTGTGPGLVQYASQRAGPGERPSGRTWFSRLRTDPPTVEVVAPVDGVMVECGATADHLVCRDSVDDLRVWRIRR